MQEWFNWLVSKTSVSKGTEGSNPSPSAMEYHTYMQETLFTKIIKGEIPSYKIYEDEKVFAFLDIDPVAEGHVLVVPKSQIEFVWDLDASDYEALTLATKKIALHLREKTGRMYVSERIVGTDVPHAHVHLIPFNDPAELHREPGDIREPDHAALAKLVESLRM